MDNYELDYQATQLSDVHTGYQLAKMYLLAEQERVVVEWFNSKLLSGYPEGETPTDVEKMREANVSLASEVVKLEALVEELRSYVKALIGVEERT